MAARMTKKAIQVPSRPKPPPVSQKGPMGSPMTIEEWLPIPQTAKPKSRARLAFQPKLRPQPTQRPRVRR